jgi:hypothetical protein
MKDTARRSGAIEMNETATMSAPGIQRIQRTGPVGRSVRLILAAAIGTFAVLRLATFAHRGPSGYRDPAVLADTSFWILGAIVVVSIVDFAGRFAPGLERFSSNARRISTVVGLLGAVVFAAGAGLALRGVVWGFPLADLLWWLDTAYLIQLAPAFGLAALLGTPGCEPGVWRDLLGHRGSGSHTPLTCVIGLHALDAWEAERSVPRGG